MSKKEQLQFISKKVRKEEPMIGDMLHFIEKKIVKTDKEQLYYISDQDVPKSAYYMFMFGDLWEKKNKPLNKQQDLCIKYFYDLLSSLKK